MVYILVVKLIRGLYPGVEDDKQQNDLMDITGVCYTEMLAMPSN